MMVWEVLELLETYGKLLVRLLLTAVLFAICFLWGTKEVFSPGAYAQPSLILDAGHGGEDGGAVSPMGAKESTINLDIVLRLDQMLGLLGEGSLMLREEDISLHDPQSRTLREKKVSDLKNRAEAVNANPDATLVSIHQNSYPETKYRGTQVFYSPTEGSQQLAQKLQTGVRTALQPDNTRQEKQIPDTVYLMNHISNRAVLVECGFLTNPEEEQLLQQPDYQRKFALVLAVKLMSE